MEQDILKAHVKGYSKKDGTFVRPHERSGEPGHASHPEPHHHPRLGENGKPVVIQRPTHASAPSTWHNPDAVATFVPDGDVPASLNGITLKAWKDHPQTDEGWEYVDGIMDDLEEPPLIIPPGKKVSAGVIIEESDGRVWLTAPTNQFGFYEATFPKGTADPGMSLQATAIREAFEETGLQVEIIGFVGDFERSTSVGRFYRARRVSGSPRDMGWESQAMHLCPRGLLYDMLNLWPDYPIAEAIGGGPAPTKKS